MVKRPDISKISQNASMVAKRNSNVENVGKLTLGQSLLNRFKFKGENRE